MIVISDNFVLGNDFPSINMNSPLIGADNLVTATNIVASSEDSLSPAVNLANPSEDLEWKASSTAAQDLTITTGTGRDLSYCGVDGHNWGTLGLTVTLRADDGAGYSDLVSFVPADDRPIVFRFTQAPHQNVRIHLSASSGEVARASVVYLGLAVVVPRRIYVGHTPITFAREFSTVNGQSQNGTYLGVINLGRTNVSEIALKNLPRDWYREYLDPILLARQPFFWAWRPETFPYEVGYVWLNGNPKPTNSLGNGMMSVTLPVEGSA